MAETAVLDIKRFLTSMKLKESKGDSTPMVSDNLKKVTEDVSEGDRFLSSLAALIFNVEPVGGKLERPKLAAVVKDLDKNTRLGLTAYGHRERCYEGINLARGGTQLARDEM